MAQCWERRGCDEEMMSRCPHNIPGEPCPADCRFAACTRSTHEVCQDFNKLLNPERDYDAAIKEVCRFCEHFLEHGPNVSDREGESGVARCLGASAPIASAYRGRAGPLHGRLLHPVGTRKPKTKGKRWQSRRTAR